MSWHDGAIATQPAGEQATAKTGIAVRCDTCQAVREFVSHAAAARGTNAVQRLLFRRGWEFDPQTGKDTCPGCVAERIRGAA